jgi:hypothetical protein
MHPVLKKVGYRAARLFADFDFEPVGQIAVDEDWTAMRFGEGA